VGGVERLLPLFVVGGREVKIKDAIERHRDSIMALDGVVGIAETVFSGQPTILVLTDGTLDEDTKLPVKLEGFKVRSENVGNIKAR